MWQTRGRVTTDLRTDVRLVMPEAALSTIFDECDGFDHDETGGRVIGTFKSEGDHLTISITGIIESGPQATRSAVSFFQDGAHQENIFRKLEQLRPEIEHLGNWHTHHVNGLETLSQGDISTYHRIVNHHNHNTSFFYALLVTKKHRSSNPLGRYSIKHFLFRRGDGTFYEIPARNVQVVNSPLVWPIDEKLDKVTPTHDEPGRAISGRVVDRETISGLFPGFRSFSSKKVGIYWRGPLELIDGSRVEAVAMEGLSRQAGTYSVVLREAPGALTSVAESLAQTEFPSARVALINAERACNQEIYKYVQATGRTHSHEKG